VSVIGFSYVLSGRYFAMIALASPAAEKVAGDAPPRLIAIMPAQCAEFHAMSLFICACSQRCNSPRRLFDFIFLLK
jgi:hypothetical protein